MLARLQYGYEGTQFMALSKSNEALANETRHHSDPFKKLPALHITKFKKQRLSSITLSLRESVSPEYPTAALTASKNALRTDI